MTNLFLLQLLNGAQLGVLLFLIAAGLTLIFGIMDFINLAHGVLYMVGAYVMASFAMLTGSFWLALGLTVPAMLICGLLLEFTVFRALYARSHLDQVLATFGLVLVISEGVKILWGSAPLTVPMPDLLSGSVGLIGPLKYPVYRLAILVVGLASALGLYVLITQTRIGMLLRAGASNREMVSALGVNVGRLFAMVFAFGFWPKRIPLRFALVLVGLLLGTAAMTMHEVHSIGMAYFAAALFGCGIGGLLTILPIAWADFFGRRSYGAIRGAALTVQVASQAAGPLITGALRDMTGTYDISLITFSIFGFIAAAVALMARPPKPILA